MPPILLVFIAPHFEKFSPIRLVYIMLYFEKISPILVFITRYIEKISPILLVCITHYFRKFLSFFLSLLRVTLKKIFPLVTSNTFRSYFVGLHCFFIQKNFANSFGIYCTLKIFLTFLRSLLHSNLKKFLSACIHRGFEKILLILQTTWLHTFQKISFILFSISKSLLKMSFILHSLLVIAHSFLQWLYCKTLWKKVAWWTDHKK